MHKYNVRFLQLTKDGISISEKEYVYNTDEALQVNDIVLAGFRSAPAIVTSENTDDKATAKAGLVAVNKTIEEFLAIPKELA